MRGEGMSRDHHRPRTRSSTKNCKVQENVDNVVIIDVDSDGFDNVIIIDVPESLQQKLRGSSVLQQGRKIPLRGIICIDDDAGDDGRDGGDTESENSPACDHIEKSEGAGEDDCQVANKKTRDFNLSKCSRTRSKKSASRNHYGLHYESESESYESGSSDCEVMEGSSEKAREQWEKASLKRRSNAHECQHEPEDEAVSCSSPDIDPCAEVENKTKQEAPFFTSSQGINLGKETSSGDAFGRTTFNSGTETSFPTSKQKVDGESFSWYWKPRTPENMSSYKKADFHHRAEVFVGDHNFSYCQSQNTNNCGTTSAQNERTCFQRTSGFTHEEDGEQNHHRRKCVKDFKQKAMRESSDYEKPGLQGIKVSLGEGEQSTEVHNVKHTKVVPDDKGKMFTQAPSCCNTDSNEVQDNCCSSSHDEEKKASGETVIDNTVTPDRKGTEKSFIQETHVKTGYQDTGETDSHERSFCRTQCHEMLNGLRSSSLAAGKEPFTDSKHGVELNNDRDPSSALAGKRKTADQTDIINDREKLKETDEYKRAVEEEWAARQLQLQIQAEEAQRLRKRRKADQTDIINDREKLKETDEYKRAVEEEWAARQLQLQIQAEEAQRLRKRRKAESLRALEMERRQKQRVEEVRESQKKDEENLNMKERLRAETRKELYRLEQTCIDMASLLRGLGVHVGGGFQPSSHEVHTAYKRALLKFHPDRASRTDIQQLVEAEEKFKLISRMKEKFLTTS